MKAIRLTNITKKQLFLYIKLRNKNQLKDKIGPFQLEFKLFQPAHLRPNRFHSELSNKVSPTIGKPKTASITKTSSSIFARRRVSQVTSKLQHKTTLKKSVTKIQTSNAFTGYKHDGTPSSNSANNSPRSSPEKSFNGSVKESILQDLPSPMSHAIEMNLPRSFVQESPSTSSLHEPLHAIEMITKPDSSIALNMISSCNVISDLRPPQWSDVDLYELPLLIAVGDKTDELQLQITVCSELFKDLPNLELFQTSLASNPTGEPTKGTLRSKSSHEELTKKHQLQSTIQLADLHQDRVLWICLNQNKKSTDSSPKSSTTSSLAGNSIRSVNLERVHSGISSSGVVNTVNVPAGPGPISSKPLFATLRNFFGNVLHLRNTLNSTNATRSVSGTLRDIKFKPPSMMTMSAGVPDQSFSLQLELQLGTYDHL